MLTAYCVKCKTKDTEMKNPKMNQTTRGGFMAKGQCVNCGTTMCKIMSKVNAEKAVTDGEAEKAY